MTVTSQPCKLCQVRQQKLANGTWDIHFKTCPHCGADWGRGQQVLVPPLFKIKEVS